MDTITVNPSLDHTEGLRGYLHIHHLWQCQTDTTIDVRVTETDAKSHLKHSLDTVLEIQEKEKKKTYILPCLDQQKHFTLFLVSVDRLPGHKAISTSSYLPEASQKNGNAHPPRHTTMSTLT